MSLRRCGRLCRAGDISYCVRVSNGVCFTGGPPPGQGGYYPQEPQQAYGGYGGQPPYGGQPGYGGPPYGGQYQPQPPPQTVYVCV